MNLSDTKPADDLYDATEETEHAAKDLFDWDKITHYVYAVVCVGSIIGIGLNILCFKTSLSLPRAKSVSSILMRHLAVWDSAALFYNLIDHGLIRILGIGWSCQNVSS